MVSSLFSAAHTTSAEARVSQIRESAWPELASNRASIRAGEVDENALEARQRQIRFLASVAARGAEDPLGRDLLQWLATMDRFAADIREALQWAATRASQHDVVSLTAALQILGAGQQWWELRGHWLEQVTWWERLAPRLSNCPADAVLAGATVSIARAEFLLARYSACEERYQHALAMANACEDWLSSAAALTGLGNTASFHRQTSHAVTFYTQALSRYQWLGRKSQVAYCLNTLGLIARQDGDLDKQLLYYREACARREQIGDTFGLAQSHMCLAVAYTDMGDADGAVPYLEKAEATLRAFDDRRFLSLHLSNAVRTYAARGDYVRALAQVEEVVVMARQVQDRRRLLYLLSVVIEPVALLGETALAATLLSATYALCKTEHIKLLTIEERRMQTDRAYLNDALTPTQMRAAWQYGEQLTLDVAIDSLIMYARHALRGANVKPMAKTAPQTPRAAVVSMQT